MADQQLILPDAARGDATACAIVDENGRHTYQKLWHLSGVMAANLLSGADDLREARVAFLVPPGLNYIAAQWAIWRGGGIAVPLGLKHPLPELLYVIDNAEPAVIVVDPEFEDRLASAVAERNLKLVTTSELATDHGSRETPLIDPARRAMMLYTSGSTGRPKGVVTTHANILAQVDSLVEAWGWTAADRILHVLPLHHIHGIVNALSCALRVGACCELLPEFDPLAVWNRFTQNETTVFMAVPTIYSKLIAAFDSAGADQQQAWSAAAASLRLMVSGSAALPVSTLERWEEMTGHRLLERYGMTEIGMALSNPLEGDRRPGFVGRPLPGVRVRLATPETPVLEDGTPGEIEVCGPTVFAEYWRQPQATQQAFRNGWFRTGDIAAVEDGVYRILGRSSVDIIKTGGYKVSALEIEDVLREHPAIIDCAVVGVPDEEWGERVGACLVGDDGELPELADLRAWAKLRLAAYKVPGLLRYAVELPRNAMGKVLKSEVQRLFDSS